MLEYRKVMDRGLKAVKSLFRAEQNYVREYCKGEISPQHSIQYP